MIRLQIIAALALLVAPAAVADPPPSPTPLAWLVTFQTEADEAAEALACRRTAERALECIALSKVLAAQREADAEAAQEADDKARRHLEKRVRWQRSFDL